MLQRLYKEVSRNLVHTCILRVIALLVMWLYHVLSFLCFYFSSCPLQMLRSVRQERDTDRRGDVWLPELRSWSTTSNSSSVSFSQWSALIARHLIMEKLGEYTVKVSLINQCWLNWVWHWGSDHCWRLTLQLHTWVLECREDADVQHWCSEYVVNFDFSWVCSWLRSVRYRLGCI